VVVDIDIERPLEHRERVGELRRWLIKDEVRGGRRSLQNRGKRRRSVKIPVRGWSSGH
jgi:hypothetical protein